MSNANGNAAPPLPNAVSYSFENEGSSPHQQQQLGVDNNVPPQNNNVEPDLRPQRFHLLSNGWLPNDTYAGVVDNLNAQRDFVLDLQSLSDANMLYVDMPSYCGNSLIIRHAVYLRSLGGYYLNAKIKTSSGILLKCLHASGTAKCHGNVFVPYGKNADGTKTLDLKNASVNVCYSSSMKDTVGLPLHSDGCDYNTVTNVPPKTVSSDVAFPYQTSELAFDRITPDLAAVYKCVHPALQQGSSVYPKGVTSQGELAKYLFASLKMGICDARSSSTFTDNICSILAPNEGQRIQRLTKIFKNNGLTKKCPFGRQTFTAVDDHPYEDRKWNETDAIAVCDNLLILINNMLSDLHVVSRKIFVCIYVSIICVYNIILYFSSLICNTEYLPSTRSTGSV